MEEIGDNTKIPENNKQETPPKVNAKMINLQSQTEQMLYNATLMTEMAIDMKDRCISGGKYVCYLRNLAIRAYKTINSMQSSSKSFLLLAQKLSLSAVKLIEAIPAADQNFANIKFEYEKLISILEKELVELEDLDTPDTALTQNLTEVNLKSISEKIKSLEDKQKSTDAYLPTSNSSKSFKSDVDEKYPESWVKESFKELDNVMNLPPVPEDMFINFTKPKRTSSLSSLKNMRKVKLFLHRAESVSDDDEESESEEHSTSKFGLGDIEETETRGTFHSTKASLLCDIKEETQQE